MRRSKDENPKKVLEKKCHNFCIIDFLTNWISLEEEKVKALPQKKNKAPILSNHKKELIIIKERLNTFFLQV